MMALERTSDRTVLILTQSTHWYGYGVAKLFGKEPEWPSTQIVLGAIVKQFDDSWMVFAEVDFQRVAQGMVLSSDADIFLCNPQHGFCFIECKGGGIRRSETGTWQQFHHKDPKKIGWQDIDPYGQAARAQKVFLEWGRSNAIVPKKFARSIALIAFPNSARASKVSSPDVEKVAIWGEDLDHLSKMILGLLPPTSETFFNPSDLRNALVGEIPPLEWVLPDERISAELQLENSQLNLKLKELLEEQVRVNIQKQSLGLTTVDLKKLNDQQDELRLDIQSLTQAISSISTHDDLRSDIQSLTQAVASIPKQDALRSEIQSLTHAISSIPSQQGLHDQKKGKLIAAITFVGIAIIVSAFILLRSPKSANVSSGQLEKSYETCRELWNDFLTGVAKDVESVRITEAVVNPTVYNLNGARDGDNDGVACELRKYTTCPEMWEDFPTGVARDAESVGFTEAVVNPTAYNLNGARDGDKDGVACQRSN